MKNDKRGLSGWLGLRLEPDFSKAKPLGGLISVILMLVVLTLIILLLVNFISALIGHGEFQVAEPQSAAIRNTGLALAAMISVPFLVWRSVVAQKQVDVAEQGHITDRISKAVEGLGAEKTVSRVSRNVSYTLNGEHHTRIEGRDEPEPMDEQATKRNLGDWEVVNRTMPNLEVRTGSIFALERIAQDSDRDHVQIMEILCAYIRQNSPAKNAIRFQIEDPDEFRTNGKLPELKRPSPDVQTALTVIGRRTSHQRTLESKVGFKINLSECNLQFADMSEGNWQKSIFVDAVLDKADLSKSFCQDADFSYASLIKTGFEDGNFGGANFMAANLSFLAPTQALFEAKSFLGAVFKHVRFSDLKFGHNLSFAQLGESDFVSCLVTHQWVYENTNFFKATFKYCAVRGMSVEDNDPLLDVIDDFFGDGSVRLPDTAKRPDSWPKEILSDKAFETAWVTWRNNRQRLDHNNPNG